MTMFINIEFGPYIRKLRKGQGLSLRSFSKMVKLSPTFISMLERGQVTPPSEHSIRQFAKVLNKDPDELLALAGRITKDWRKILRDYPEELAQFFKLAGHLSKKDWRELTKQAANLAGKPLRIPKRP